MRRLILRSVALGALIPSIAAAQENCKPATDATKLPAVSALLDSASLIKNLPAPDLAASKEVFVRVTTTATPRAVVQDTVVAKTEGGKVLVQKVLASLKPNAKSLASAFRLRILLGEAPALAVVPDLVCPPKHEPLR
jgi:hypothetical protein